MRVAAIDVGSNAVRLLVAEPSTRRRDLRTIAEGRVATQLAKGLAETGRLNARAVGPTIEAIRAFAARASELSAARVRAVATAAVREASNGAEFARRVAAETGIVLEIISADQEGLLAYTSLSRRFNLSTKPAAAIDIGGGSAQVVTSVRGVLTGVISLPLGAVRVTDAYGGWGRLATSQYRTAKADINHFVADALKTLAVRPEVLVGTGGTIMTLATLVQADAPPPGWMNERRVTRAQVRRLIEEFRKSAPELPEVARGLPPDRSEIAFAGLMVLDSITRGLTDPDADPVVRAHPGGLREGVCWRLIDHDPKPTDAMRAARAFAARCKYPRAHSEQVARLAMALFDGLAETPPIRKALGLEPRARELLEAAAVLHDIGILVSYRRHHKHSASMIRCAGPLGLSPAQTDVVAAVARYHRRSGPSLAHAEFAALDSAQRELTMTLSGLLRVADSLDRSHRSLVRGLSVRADRDGVVIDVRTARPRRGRSPSLAAEVAAVADKSDVFRATFGELTLRRESEGR